MKRILLITKQVLIDIFLILLGITGFATGFLFFCFGYWTSDSWMGYVFLLIAGGVWLGTSFAIGKVIQKEEKKILNRKETTKFLSELLVRSRLSGRGKYWASEVSIDYGTSNVKRVDFMQFEPKGVVFQSDIEKGTFTCYEVKSCKEDVYSGNGLNFIGEKNYIVTTMECYKDIQPDMRSGKLWKHIKTCCPEASPHYGIMVPVPFMVKPEDEYANPTELDADVTWEMKVIYPCNHGGRRRSTTELLFCMLRSGHM